MKRIVTALLLAATVFGAHTAEPDKEVDRVLKQLDYPYEIDDAEQVRLRSPLVWEVVADYLGGQRYPLSIVRETACVPHG